MVETTPAALTHQGSVALVVKVVKSFTSGADPKSFDRLDQNACRDLHKKMDSELIASKLNKEQKVAFAKKNDEVLEHWDGVFPTGITQCLSQYFQRNTTPDVQHVGYDPRFPNMNQTKKCFINFVDHQRCLKQRGADASECDYFKNIYVQLCPTFWVDHWKEQLENDAFPVKGLP